MSVLKRGRVWWYNFVFQGTHYQQSARKTTREAALQIEAIRKAELASLQSSQIQLRLAFRFADFVKTEFDPWCAVEHKDRPSTYARYMRSLKVLNEFFGSQVLQAINAGAVEKYKIQRSQQKRKHARDGHLVTPVAVNRDLAVLRILFNYAIRLGFVDKNPVAQVRFFREKQSCMRVVSTEEELRYLAAAAPLLQDVATLMLIAYACKTHPSQVWLPARQTGEGHADRPGTSRAAL